MQRVAQDLHAALLRRADVELHDAILRTTWRATHLRIVPFLLALLRAIPEIVRSESIEMVLFSSMVTAGIAPRLRRKLVGTECRMATITHGQDVITPNPIYQRYVPKIFAVLDAVLPVSSATGAECVARGCDPQRVHVVPNGISTARFSVEKMSRAEAGAILSDLAGPIPAGALLLCSVGRQVERKGFQWFAGEVMPLTDRSVHYWMAGDGPMAESIEAAIRMGGTSERVKRLGKISDQQLDALLTRADLFVMPNIPVAGDMEGFGVVLLEAGLHDLPSVAARLEGIQDVITEGVNGYMVESGDAAAFAHVIERSRNDREGLQRMSDGVRRHVNEMFSWDAVAGRVVDVLRAAQSTRGPGDR